MSRMLVNFNVIREIYSNTGIHSHLLPLRLSHMALERRHLVLEIVLGDFLYCNFSFLDQLVKDVISLVVMSRVVQLICLIQQTIDLWRVIEDENIAQLFLRD